MAQQRFPHPTGAAGIGDSIAALAEDTSKLIHLEIDLFKQEVAGLIKRNAIAVAMLALAGLAAFLTLIFLVVTLIVAVKPHWLVALIVAAVFGVLAAVLALLGKSRLRITGPQQTIESIKEDLEWAKAQIKPAPR